MNENRNGTEQASTQSLCGRFAVSMGVEQAHGAPGDAPLQQDEIATAPTPRRQPRLSTSERLRRLEEFSAA